MTDLIKIDKIISILGGSYSFGNKIICHDAIPDELTEENVLEIQLLAIQILESAHILEHSVSISTVRDRAHFLKARVRRLLEYHSKHGQSILLDLELGVDKFKKTYKKKIRKEAIELILNPDIEDLELKVQQTIHAGWKRHLHDQEQQISRMIMKKAIKRRLDDLVEMAGLLLLDCERLTGCSFDYHEDLGHLHHKASKVS